MSDKPRMKNISFKTVGFTERKTEYFKKKFNDIKVKKKEITKNYCLTPNRMATIFKKYW